MGMGNVSLCLWLELATVVLYGAEYLVKYGCDVQGAPLTLFVALFVGLL